MGSGIDNRNTITGSTNSSNIAVKIKEYLKKEYEFKQSFKITHSNTIGDYNPMFKEQQALNCYKEIERYAYIISTQVSNIDTPWICLVINQNGTLAFHYCMRTKGKIMSYIAGILYDNSSYDADILIDPTNEVDLNSKIYPLERVTSNFSENLIKIKTKYCKEAIRYNSISFEEKVALLKVFDKKSRVNLKDSIYDHSTTLVDVPDILEFI